jgi:hypothetical protein
VSHHRITTLAEERVALSTRRDLSIKERIEVNTGLRSVNAAEKMLCSHSANTLNSRIGVLRQMDHQP